MLATRQPMALLRSPRPEDAPRLVAMLDWVHSLEGGTSRAPARSAPAAAAGLPPGPLLPRAASTKLLPEEDSPIAEVGEGKRHGRGPGRARGMLLGKAVPGDASPVPGTSAD